MVACLELAGIEQHHPPADGRERVLELKVVEDRALGDDVLEQGPQVGDIPLAVAQLVDQAALGFVGRDMKRLIESAVGGPNAQRGVEDQQGLAHRIHDVLGIVLNILDQRFSFHHDHLFCMLRGEHRAASSSIGCSAPSFAMSSGGIGHAAVLVQMGSSAANMLSVVSCQLSVVSCPSWRGFMSAPASRRR